MKAFNRALIAFFIDNLLYPIIFYLLSLSSICMMFFLSGLSYIHCSCECWILWYLAMHRLSQLYGCSSFL